MVMKVMQNLISLSCKIIQCVRYDNKDNEQHGSISKVVDDNTDWILNE